MALLVFTLLALGIPTHAADSGLIRKASEITIYSDRQALVKEDREFDLSAGIVYTSSYSVPIGFEPNSVQIRALNNASNIEVLEENFDPGLSGEDEILKKSIGQEVSVEESNSEASLPHILRGILLESQGNLKVVKSEGRIYLNPPGTFILKASSLSLQFKPTLRWKLKVLHAGHYQFETDYLMSGLSWKADYAALVNSSSDRMDLSVWASLNNDSGIDFPKAKIKLVAGNPNQAVAATSHPLPLFHALAASSIRNILKKGKTFFEYHIYHIPGVVNLNGRTRRISFGQAKDIPIQKIYLYDASNVSGEFSLYTRTNPDYGVESQGEVQVLFKLQNIKSSHLGLALPPGKIRLYQKDREGSLEWIGEDALSPLAKGEKVNIQVGRAFDVTGSRTRTAFESDKKKTEESFKIVLKNHKKSDIVVKVVEHLYRWSRWKIVSASAKWTEKDAQTIEFDVPVLKNSKSEVDYSVKYFWK